MITLRAPQRDRSVPVVEPRRRPNLRVVDLPDTLLDTEGDLEPTKRTASGVVSTLLVLLLFVCIFGVVVFQVFLVQTQSHLDDLGDRIAVEDARAKQLRLDTADLESPDRILADGRRLQMIAPGEIGFLSPKPDDDEKGRFDPTAETVPVPTTVTTVPSSPGSYPGSGATSSNGTAGATTPTKTTPTPTTVKPTPTTVKPTPTTAKPTTTTAKPTTTTTAKPKPTTAPTTRATGTR